MSVDPQAMLEQLRAEQPSVISQPAEAGGGSDPSALLEQLRSESQGNPESFEKPTETKEKRNIVRRMFDAMQSPSFSAQTLKFIAGGFLDDEGEVVIPVDGKPIDILKKKTKAQAAALEQGVKEAGQGAVQMSFDALEGMGIAPEGLTEYYTGLSDEQRKQFEADFNEEFGDVGKFAFSRGAGKTLPVLAVAPVVAAKTIKGQLVAGAAFGASAAAAEYIPESSEEERHIEALKGAGLGFLLTGAMNVAPAIKNWLRGKVGKAALETPTAKKGIKLMERTGRDLKLSQITDDPLIAELETVARRGGITMQAERAARETEAKAVRGVLNHWRKTVESIKDTTGEFGTRLQSAFNKTLGDSAQKTGLLGARLRQAKIDYAAANKASGGERNIPVAEFKKNAGELISKYRNSISSEKRLFAKQLIETLKRPDIRNGNINAARMQDMLETYGTQGAKSGRIWRDIDPKLQESAAKFLFKGTEKDLTKAINSGVKGSKELGIARDNYSLNSENINKLRDSALFNMFGGKVPKTNDELITQISNMKPDRLKQTMALLSKSDPGLHNELQRNWIEKSLNKAMKTTDIGSERFNAAEMLKLADDKKLLPIFNDVAVRRQVMDGIRLSQRVIAHNTKQPGVGQTLLMKAAGVAASRDKTFVARLATELFTPAAVSKYVLHKDGIKVLQSMAKTKNANVIAAGLIRLNNLNKETEEE